MNESRSQLPRGTVIPTAITASMLYDLVTCPHRVTMDLSGHPEERDQVSPFVQLLWERGATHEREVIANVADRFVDLSQFSDAEKEQRTIEAISRGESLIYGGRIVSDDLVGEPDLIRRERHGYIAGDIKSGAGQEDAGGDGDGKPKKHYAVQLALYTDILERLGCSAGRHAFVWDVHGQEILYDFTTPFDREHGTLWEYYQNSLTQARKIVDGQTKTTPAYSTSTCKNCVWYSSCLRQLEAADDLTLIPELGRTRRDAMASRIGSIHEFAQTNLATLVDGPTTVFDGIGPLTLEKLHQRARLLSSYKPKPYRREPINLPVSDTELFFDIEVDPTRDLCYLHGFIERRNGDNRTERFVSFFADDLSQAAEEQAFTSAVRYMKNSQPCVIYYYSKYERTIYRKLREKYPRNFRA